MVEISDGYIDIDHDQNCKIIKDFKKDFKVISEVEINLNQKIIK